MIPTSSSGGGNVNSKGHHRMDGVIIRETVVEIKVMVM